jgi:hypothetical protein
MTMVTLRFQVVVYFFSINFHEAGIMGQENTVYEHKFCRIGSGEMAYYPTVRFPVEYQMGAIL